MDDASCSQTDLSDSRREEAAYAQSILANEAEAISRLHIDQTFHDAVELILNSAGALVVTGLGKSGLIGQKISATFASTGTPSHVLHPTEAVHGDLGRVRRGDVVLAISYGGNTEEVVALVTILRQDRVPVIAIVGLADSDLGRLATIRLCIGEVGEACPMNLAPTTSTTAMLALGDALALCVSRRRHFDVADFHKVHPGGALGRQLMPVTAALRWKAGENLPLVQSGATVKEALGQTDQLGRRGGALLIVDRDNRLVGIFTDADLRRQIIAKGHDALGQPIEQVMATHPRALTEHDLVRDAVQLAREHRIDEIPVVNSDGQPLGLLDVQDLIALKVIES